MTLRALQDAVLEELGYAQSGTSSDVLVRITRRLNEWHRRLLSRPGLTRYLRQSFSCTFVTVAGQKTYGLPPAVGRVNSLRELTNDVKLELRDIQWVTIEDPGETGVGVPEVYAPMGWFPVQKHPSNASVLYVASSDAGDTTQTVVMDYLNSSGVLTSTSVPLNGTTAVAIGTAAVEVMRFFVTPLAAGSVTLREDSDVGTLLGTIPAGRATSRYLHLRLWPTPQDAITYLMDAVRESTDMVDQADEPLLPEDFHYLLVLGVTADEFRMRDDTRYAAMRQDMEAGLRDLNNWLWNLADYSPGGARGEHSRLGGWYPAGT